VIVSRFNIRKFGWFLLTSLFFAATALMAHAQSSANNPIEDPTQIRMRFPDGTATIDRQDATSDMRRLRLLNVARQKAMVSDAEKLLALARDLNAGIGVDGTALSPAQRTRMTADIEKLAHSIKEKMSYVAGNPSAPRGPFNAAPW
jgi:hypothetical protein